MARPPRKRRPCTLTRAIPVDWHGPPQAGALRKRCDVTVFRLQIVALVAQAMAIALHTYLSVQGFAIQLGMSSGSALCKIGAAFDCSSVAASPYSQLLGIPMSIWGLVANLLLFVLLVLWAFKWVDEIQRLGRYCLYLVFGVACVSVLMGSVSLLIIQKLCIFCIGAYALSFISLAAIWVGYIKSAREGQRSKHQPPASVCSLWVQDFKLLFTSKRVLFLLAVPAATFLVNKSFLSHYEAQDVKSIARAMLREWRVNPEKDFGNTPALISKGASDADTVMQINEFADFLCGHCKRSATPIAAFTASRPGVQFNFYAFPLDGACNEAIARSSGVPCFLAQLVYCAGQQQQAWPLHDLLFQHQENLYRQANVEAAQQYLQPMIEHNIPSLDLGPLYECAASDAAREKVAQQAALGKKLGIQGTPTIFVNNKQLDRGQVIPVLEAVYNDIQQGD